MDDAHQLELSNGSTAWLSSDAQAGRMTSSSDSPGTESVTVRDHPRPTTVARAHSQLLCQRSPIRKQFTEPPASGATRSFLDTGVWEGQEPPNGFHQCRIKSDPTALKTLDDRWRRPVLPGRRSASTTIPGHIWRSMGIANTRPGIHHIPGIGAGRSEPVGAIKTEST